LFPIGVTLCSIKEARIDREEPFLNALFNLVEELTGMELRTTSKKVILNYLNESRHPQLVYRARAAIVRYIQDDIPTLDEIREKSQHTELDAVDHLVLKLEYEAQRLQGE